MPTLEHMLDVMCELHERIRDAVVNACEAQSLESLSSIAADDAGDTIYAVDRVSEELLIDVLREEARSEPLVLIAEGIEGGALVLPEGAAAEEAQWRIIVDPIDGTRGIMYQKRSAWILSGIAPNKGPQTGLRDIVAAVQTEIPLVKQHLSDQLRAVRGAGVTAERFNRFSGERRPLQLQPSQSDSIAHGFAMISRFFPGGRDVLADLDDALMQRVLGPPQPGKAQCFEDQYASSGGQFYELMCGHDRFNADLRPLLEVIHNERGMRGGICCHPYDVCTLLIAEELGVIVTDDHGQALDAPLNLDADVCWIGYANQTIRGQLETVLHEEMAARGLLTEAPT